MQPPAHDRPPAQSAPLHSAPQPAPPARLRNPLQPWQRRLLDGAGWALLATGALWLALHYGGHEPAGESLPHPLEPWALRLHGLAGFAALFVLGALASAHVPRGWRITAHRAGHGLERTARAVRAGRAQRRWGVVLCALAALLAASAWLLYYFAPDPVRPALGLAHSAAGLAMALALWLHRRTSLRGLPRRSESR